MQSHQFERGAYVMNVTGEPLEISWLWYSCHCLRVAGYMTKTVYLSDHPLFQAPADPKHVGTWEEEKPASSHCLS